VQGARAHTCRPCSRISGTSIRPTSLPRLMRAGGSRAWTCRTWTSRAQRPDAPSALRLRLPDDQEAHEHRGDPQRYEADAFHDPLRLSARRLLRPRPEDPEDLAACGDCQHGRSSSSVPALIASRPAARAGTHVTTKDLCIWPNLQDFGVDVGAVFPIVALGKPAPMPYVWHPRRETERARSEHRRCPQKWWKCLTP
jgi:hypothetical protein